ncbi:hypothetical protein RSA28_05890 [Rothia kristinae]|nr:hypothetical protein SA14R_08325 [Rothia kristinae]KTR80218.1 hypothetical protein RSA28_05890 [Rothia kristinae]
MPSSAEALDDLPFGIRQGRAGAAAVPLRQRFPLPVRQTVVAGGVLPLSLGTSHHETRGMEGPALRG